MKGKRWLNLILYSAASAALPPLYARAQEAPRVDVAASEIEQQKALLFNATSSQKERDEAARRLLQRGTEDVLMTGLRGDNVDVQLAVARALRDAANPPPQFLDELAMRLGTNTEFADAASVALSNYKDTPRAVERLKEFAARANVPERLRRLAVRALGTLNDKETARFLVETLLKGDNQQIADAAASALQEMTGHIEFGNDVGQWERWWSQQRNKSPKVFEDERLTERSSDQRQMAFRLQQLAQSIEKFTASEMTQKKDARERDEYVLRVLKNEDAVIRAAGATMVVKRSQQTGEKIGAEVTEQLRGMIGDSSVEVRIRVAEAIKAVNLQGVAQALLAQVQRESRAAAKVAMINAMPPSKDATVVPELVKLLDDPSYQVAEAAAGALAELAPQLAGQPAASDLSNALLRRLERTSRVRGATRLRERLVEAMVPLKDAGLVRPLFDLLNLSNEQNTPNVRLAAVRALAGINSAALQADIATNLANVLVQDPVAGVRLDAATALGVVGSPAQSKQLTDVMERDSDEEVRNAAWRSLSSLFVQFDEAALQIWANQHNQPDRRLTALKVLNEKWTEKVKQDPRAEESRAVTQQDIGALLLDPRIDQPAEAIPYLDAALSYWDNKRPASTENLQTLLIRAHLRAKKYADAVAFADARITKDASNQDTMGREVLFEVDRLQKDKKSDDALRLLDDARKSKIKGRYHDTFERLAEELKSRVTPFQDLFPLPERPIYT